MKKSVLLHVLGFSTFLMCFCSLIEDSISLSTAQYINIRIQEHIFRQSARKPFEKTIVLRRLVINISDRLLIHKLTVQK